MTLDALLAALPPGTVVNVELKERGLAADALAVAADHPVEVLVSSFDPETLREARDADADVPRAFIYDGNPGGNLDLAGELDCTFVHLSTSLCTNAYVDAAHERGFGVNAWTLTVPESGNALAAVGVDGVTADRPDVLS